MHEILCKFEIQTEHLIPSRRPDLVLNKKNKKAHHLMDFTVPAGHKVKIKDNGKIDKYLDFAREQRKKIF